MRWCAPCHKQQLAMSSTGREGESMMAERIDRNPVEIQKEYGPIDEIVCHGSAHLEQLDKNRFFLSMVFADGTEHCVWFKGRITYEERREAHTTGLPLDMAAGE
jgi:hypothetical protein